MLLPVSTGLESARDPGPSTATVDSDAARVIEFNRGIPSGCMQEFVASSIRKSTQVDNLQDMDVLTVLDVLIEQL